MTRFVIVLVAVLVVLQIMTFLVVVSQDIEDLPAGSPADNASRSASVRSGTGGSEASAKVAAIEAIVRQIDRKIGNLERRVTSMATKVDGVQRSVQRAIASAASAARAEGAASVARRPLAAEDDSGVIDDTPRNPQELYEMSQLGDGTAGGEQGTGEEAADEDAPVENEAN